MLRAVTATAAVIGGAAAVWSAVEPVPAGSAAVIFDRFQGVLPGVREGPTVLFVAPLLQSAIVMQTDPQLYKLDCPLDNGHNVRLLALAGMDPARLPEIFKSFGRKAQERVVPALLEETASKCAVGAISAEELRRCVHREANARMTDFGFRTVSVEVE